MKSKMKIRDWAMAMFRTKPKSGLRLRGEVRVEHRDRDGNLISTEIKKNLVVNVGLDHALDIVLSAGTQVTTWYIGLKNAGAVAATDTSASHAGWTENTSYSEANRVTWTDGGVSGQSVNNSASPAVFTSNADSQAIAGVFLISNNTKGGSTGTLFSAVDFASVKNLDTSETLTVTYTFTAADDGA